MNKYKVLQNRDLEKLEKEVNKHIALGYEPVGGITVSMEPRRSGLHEVLTKIYFQAVQ